MFDSLFARGLVAEDFTLTAFSQGTNANFEWLFKTWSIPVNSWIQDLCFMSDVSDFKIVILMIGLYGYG